MSSLFKSPERRAAIADWHGRFRARIPHPTQARVVQTRFGHSHLLVGGPESGPPVVLLHGALASSAHVLRELSGLLDRFRVYAVDLVGQSAMSAEASLSVKNDDYGHWLAEVLDGLGLERPAVVAVSMGGFVALRLAASAPERIARLALLVPAGMVNGPAWAGFTRMALPMMLYRMSPTPRRLDGFMRHLLSTPDEEWRGYLGEAFLSYTLKLQVPKLATVEELRAFTAPVLVVGADRDVSFPGEALLERARALFSGRAQTELVEGAHSPPTTDAFRAWLSKRVGDFLLAG